MSDLAGDVASILDRFDSAPVECDGFVRVAVTVLVEKGISHTAYIGCIEHVSSGKVFEPHFWLDLPGGRRADYRARMWLGNGEDIPHGVFDPKDYPDVVYAGRPIELEPLPPALFAVLVGISGEAKE